MSTHLKKKFNQRSEVPFFNIFASPRWSLRMRTKGCHFRFFQELSNKKKLRFYHQRWLKWGGSWEKVHNVQIFSFCFLTYYGGFNEETSVENRLKKNWGIVKLRHFLWHAFTCICMTRHDFDRGSLYFAAGDVVYLFAWAAPNSLKGVLP